MRCILSLFIAFLFCGTAYSHTVKTPLILLSIDGFSYDYLTTYQPPNILNFAKNGTSAKLLPVYPSKTFPNHLSIITGVYPAKHGIIHNTFYHPNLNKKYRLGAGKHSSDWVTAKPFWALAQESRITSTVYFWPESEVKNWHRPHYNIPYNNKDTNKARFDQIINWLKLPADNAPQFIVSYFSSVDSAGHDFGPNSPEVAQAVANIDNLFGYFIKRLAQEIPHGVNIILVSDHGMMPIDINKSIDLAMVFPNDVITLLNEKVITVTQSDTQLYVYFKQNKLEQKNIIKKIIAKQKTNTHLYNVYQKNNYPEHWQFNHNRAITPDLIIEAKPQATFKNKQQVNTKQATHGYDALKQAELTAIFIASGPNINKGKTIKPFENIHIVPLMSQLLGIKPPKNIDGKKSVLTPLLNVINNN